MWDLFLISLIPMILFVIVDYKAGVKTGVWTAIGSSIGLGLFFWYLLDELDYEFLLMIGAMAVTGAISIKKNSAIYFKFQPVITNTVGILFIGWYQFFDIPIMIKYLPKMQKFMPPAQFEQLSGEAVQGMLGRASIFMMVMLAVHSLIIAHAALRLTNRYWLLTKALGLPFVALGVVAMELVWVAV
jgi:hypothetical protein